MSNLSITTDAINEPAINSNVNVNQFLLSENCNFASMNWTHQFI